MRSVNQALAWELARHWHWLVGSLLLSNALPFALLAALKPMGIANQSREFVLLYITLVPLSILLVGLGYLVAMGGRHRLFSLPISNNCLANWALWGGALWTGVAVASGISILNMMFGIQWPWLTTSCFAMTAWCVIQPLLGAPIGSAGRLVAILVAIVGLVYSFASRSSFASNKMRGLYWTELTLIEAIVMLIVSALSFVAFLRVVEWERCGESESKGDEALKRLWGSLDSLADRLRPPLRENATLGRALLWHEWRVKGYLYPVLTGFFAAIFALVVLVDASGVQDSEYDTELRPRFMSITLFWISVAAIPAGLVFGMTGTNATEDTSKKGSRSRIAESLRDSTGMEMGAWMRTLPITSNRLATAMIQNMALSLGVGLFVWFVIALGAYAVSDARFLPALLRFSSLPSFWIACVVLPWTIALNMMAVTASGRLFLLLGVCFAIPVAVVLLSTPFPMVSIATGVILCGIYLAFHLRLMRDAWTACSRWKWIAAGAGVALLSFFVSWCMSTYFDPTSILSWYYATSLVLLAVIPVVTLPVLLDGNRCR